MVKIPTYEQQGEYRPSGRIVQGVRTPADDGIARGIQKLGQATLEVAGRIQQANLDQELVKAETDLRVRMDKARQAIELDPETPDVAIPQRWKQESELIIGEVGGTISSSRARELWTIRARGLQAEGDTWSVNLQRKRQVDGVRAGFVAMASEAETMAGDASISPETYASKIGGLRALNASHLESGFIDKEEAARREVLLDGYAAKDMQIRLSDQAEALVRAGDEAGAKALLDSVGDAATKKLVEASIKGTKTEIEAENAKREKEVREAQITASNELEVGILKGEVRSEKDIQAAVNAGQIDVNDQPALIRALRSEQERRKREAEIATGLTASQKAALADQSADFKVGFELVAQENPAVFMGAIETWPEEHQRAYAAMLPDDQRAIVKLQAEMRIAGPTSKAIDSVLSEVMGAAKRAAPSLLSDENSKLAFSGILYRNSKMLSEAQGGKPVTWEQAQKVVLQSMAEYDKNRFGAGVDVALENMDIQQMRSADPDMWGQVSSLLQKRKGSPPTAREVAAEIRRLDELDVRSRAFTAAKGG